MKLVALLFSEFYFYLVAYKDEETSFPAVFRVDRIETMEKTGDHFQIPYRDRFKDGEFRKRVQFMSPGGSLSPIAAPRWKRFSTAFPRQKLFSKKKEPMRSLRGPMDPGATCDWEVRRNGSQF